MGALVISLGMLLPTGALADLAGLTGIVQLTYEHDDAKDPTSGSARNSLIQDYQLHYVGEIYNPNLFSYSLGGEFTGPEGLHISNRHRGHVI